MWSGLQYIIASGFGVGQQPGSSVFVQIPYGITIEIPMYVSLLPGNTCTQYSAVQVLLISTCEIPDTNQVHQYVSTFNPDQNTFSARNRTYALNSTFAFNVNWYNPNSASSRKLGNERLERDLLGSNNDEDDPASSASANKKIAALDPNLSAEERTNAIIDIYEELVLAQKEKRNRLIKEEAEKLAAAAAQSAREAQLKKEKEKKEELWDRAQEVWEGNKKVKMSKGVTGMINRNPLDALEDDTIDSEGEDERRRRLVSSSSASPVQALFLGIIVLGYNDSTFPSYENKFISDLLTALPTAISASIGGVSYSQGASNVNAELAYSQGSIPDYSAVVGSISLYNWTLTSYTSSSQPTLSPTKSPTKSPTVAPIFNSLQPSLTPSLQPSLTPSLQPSLYPSIQPSVNPTAQPFSSTSSTNSPSLTPTASTVGNSNSNNSMNLNNTDVIIIIIVGGVAILILIILSILQLMTISKRMTEIQHILDATKNIKDEELQLLAVNDDQNRGGQSTRGRPISLNNSPLSVGKLGETTV
jgi:biopolymer transport protein ExbB/TolQ